ncbi:MAG: efflux RND transporter periplasmic adaptor subunit [Gemmatimonadaceae bacterium]
MSTPLHDLSKLRIDRAAPPPRRRRIPLIIGGIVGLIAIGFAGYQLLGRGALPVQVVVASPLDGGTPGQATESGAVAVTANGYVVARTRASVAAKLPGRLATLNVSEGSYVQRGALLAQIENADFVAAVEEARANLASTRAQLVEVESDRDQLQRDADRLQRIRAENPNLTSAQELDAAESRAAQAKARANSATARVDASAASLRLAEVNLDNTFIRAPFTGTVLRKEAEVGEVVAPSVGGGLTRGAVVTMADLSTLEVEVDVNEAYIGRVTRGQTARITLDAYPDTAFRGTVRQVVPTADRQRATVQVKVSITDRDPRILPEMGSRVDFITAAAPRTAGPAAPAESSPRFRLPSDAIRSVDGRTAVWLVREGRLVLREVDAGPVSAGFREVRRGLSGGEQVVTGELVDPVAGKRVTIVSPQP